MKQTMTIASPASSRLPAAALFLSVTILVLAGFLSLTVYRTVRDSVAHSVTLPSFERLTQQGGLGKPQPESQPAPTEPAVAVAGETPAPTPEGKPEVIPEPLTEERINILILGIDQRAGEQGGFRTDTMIVATFDPQTGQAGMLSIPRDLWVPIPGYADNRINTAHFLGDVQKEPGGGPALAVKTVSYNLGVPIHYYVRLNFEGFKQIVDTIGGLDINVPTEIIDNSYPDEAYGYDPLYIPAGPRHMDGELALKYARTRHTDNDFGRAIRQQQVIVAIKDKVLTLNLLPSLLPKLPELMRTLSDSVQTDMPLDVMIRLASIVGDIDMGNVQSVVIDTTMTVPHTTTSGAQVLLPIREQIRPAVDALFWGALPTALSEGAGE